MRQWLRIMRSFNDNLPSRLQRNCPVAREAAHTDLGEAALADATAWRVTHQLLDVTLETREASCADLRITTVANTTSMVAAHYVLLAAGETASANLGIATVADATALI